MHRRDYETRVLDELDSCQAIHDPAHNFNSHVDKVRQAIFEKNSGEELSACPESNPPRLYGLPKIHKPGALMRQVVFYISSPIYSLAKYLDECFKSRNEFSNPDSVPNSITRIQ